MPTEYDYERECNEIDETLKQKSKLKHTSWKLDLNKSNHTGNICCEGCYKIGYSNAIEEVEKIIKNTDVTLCSNPDCVCDTYVLNKIKQQLQELKSKGEGE